MSHKILIGTVVGLAWCLLSGCSVKESGNGDKKNVEIQTPVGGMSIKSSENADPKATGLPAYPGAVQVADAEGDKNANINMSFGGFGLKVAAVHYHTDEPMQNVMDFYKKELSKYGTVLICDAKMRRDAPSPDKGSDTLTCSDKTGNHSQVSAGEKDDTELKVGTQHRQHIVAVKSKSGGTEFDLVYVEVRDGKQDSM